MFSSVGKLIYSASWLIVKADNGIISYYSSLLNLAHRSVDLQLPKHGAHITVVSGKYEQPKDFTFWGKYQGRELTFYYDPEAIEYGGSYYWMPVVCEELTGIREELGLKPRIKWQWHLTIGNLKHERTKS